MTRFVIRRLLLGIVAVIGVSIITFVGTRLSGDVTYLLLPENATEQDITRIRADLGLDQPIPVQYAKYVGNAFTGDFGRSIKHGVPAMDLVTRRLPATVQLAVSAFAVAVVAGVPLGVAAAIHRQSAIDRVVTTFGLVGQAMPNFWVGIMLLLVFGVQLGWLPTAGRGSPAHLVLPTIALSWFLVAAFMRLTRASMIEVLDSDYVKLSRLKGNPWRVTVWKHAVRNAVSPLVSYAGLSLATLLGGAVIVESVFAWPGLGQLMISAIYSRDYPVVQAGVFIASIVFVAVNFLVDVGYGFLDPRIREGSV